MDQPRQRALVTLEVWWAKLRYKFGRVFQLAGFALVVLGGYALLHGRNFLLTTQLPPISEVLPPIVYNNPLVTFPTGNVVLIGVGMIVVWTFT